MPGLLDMMRPRRALSPAAVTLQTGLANLPADDQSFAASLLSAARAGTLTAKQTDWLGKLAARAGAAPVVRTDGLEPIVAMLAEAARTLKWPTVRFEADGVHYRLGRSGPASREPGSVNVTDDAKGFDARKYFGRIGLDGVFTPHEAGAASSTAIGAALQAFAAAPAEQARLYGQRFGRCCFCSLELTNKASVAAGYGPICAEKYSLPWGEI